jgi:hypothetical protein
MHSDLRREDFHDPECLHGVYDRPSRTALPLDVLTVPIEALSLLGREQTAAGEQKRAHAETADHLDLSWPVAKPPVLAEYGQLAPSAQLEPLDIRYLLVALTIDLVMGAQRPTGQAQSSRDAMTAKAGSTKNSGGRRERDT